MERQSHGDPRSQPQEEDMDIGYEDNRVLHTFEGLEQRFFDDIMKLSKEQIDAEDAENARHRERKGSGPFITEQKCQLNVVWYIGVSGIFACSVCFHNFLFIVLEKEGGVSLLMCLVDVLVDVQRINAINAQYQEQLVALRARHAGRREEFLWRESQARQQQYRQIVMEQYPPSDPRGFNAEAASAQEPNRAYNSDSYDSYRERGRFPGNARDHGYEPKIPYTRGRAYDTGSRYY
ncbi:UNVERIFIED_CONTAM: hypothetical protein Sradi_0331500 [Sesamum radiatum]|uniref:Uncharacterized protein n=1 Tax=Sesamum radiatum TaxID=300843 RepID=A0AAW2W4S9_SESRA